MKDSGIRIISGYRVRIIQLKMLWTIYSIALRVFNGPLGGMRGMKELYKMRKITHNQRLLPRMVRRGKEYFPTENMPAWPSEGFRRFISREFARIRDKHEKLPELHTVIFSITSKCLLKCEHCYEWDNLSSREKLTFAELDSILEKLIHYGVSNVQISGGEPLNRFEDLVKLLVLKNGRADFWILTSGMGLTSEKAVQLKTAGLKGAIISLDHWNEEMHNQFRHHKESFRWVQEAVKNCHSSGLIPALSLCVTKEFLSEENLWRYADLARSMNIGFIRLLEPLPAGRYASKDVLLTENEKQVIEHFFLDIMTFRKHKDYQVVMYPGYHQKYHGCFGAGNRYIHIDANGDVHACPFCQGSAGNILTEDLEHLVDKLRNRGCHLYRTV